MKFYLMLFFLVVNSVFALSSDLFTSANQLYLSADAEMLVDPSRAKNLYVDAARMYESIAKEDENLAVSAMFNAGNAWFMAKEYGKALFCYKYGEQFSPASAIKENIHAIYSMRLDEFVESFSILEALTHSFYLIFGTERNRFWLLFVLNWIASLSLLAYLFRWNPIYNLNKKKWFCLTWFIFVAVIVFSIVIPQKSYDGVITSEVTAKKGPSLLYESAYQGKVNPGTEFLFLTELPQWLQVELPDRSQVWIPKNTFRLYDF